MIADTAQLKRTDFHVLTSDGFQIAVREVRLSAGDTKGASDHLVSRATGSGNRVVRSAGTRWFAGRRSGKVRICRLCDGREGLWQLD
jgi:hypothetical protein